MKKSNKNNNKSVTQEQSDLKVERAVRAIAKAMSHADRQRAYASYRRAKKNDKSEE